MSNVTVVPLNRKQFPDAERLLLRHGPFEVTGFRFSTGVAAVRMRNEVGELVMLPFQGQQIWSAHFHGRELTMQSMFREPNPTTDYLRTYGAFFIHCGVTAMGVPSEQDTHPLHGELPNAPFQRAYLIVGEDERGPYVGLGGRYQHTVAFNTNYVAEPVVRLYAGSSVFRLHLAVTNLKRTPMELMYLAHINFRPVDNGRLVYSAPCTPEHVRVRESIPSHIHPPPGYREFLDELARHPEKHNILRPGLAFDPEVVFTVDYLADEEGWAHSLHIHPDGQGDYVRHRPEQLDKGIRWICRTPDQDALGLVLPATAEPEGYIAEKRKGNIKVLPAGGTFHVDLEIGALLPEEVPPVEAKIRHILEQYWPPDGPTHQRR